MTSLSDYIKPRGWSTKNWGVDKEGPIPGNAFPFQGILLIGQVPGALAVNLSWLNEAGQHCWIEGIPFLEDGSLSMNDISVGFGNTPGNSPITLGTVTFYIKDEELHGTLTSPGYGDGNTGTYVADANPGGQVPPGIRVEELASA
jgi:hypothetical protein